MIDTISAKALISANIDAAELDSTVRTFPRIASSGNEARRQSLHVSSLSPTTLRISHQPRKTATDVQRSLCAIDQTLARLDTSSNPIGETKFKVAFQTDIPSDVTKAEWRAAVMLLFGTLLESDGAMLDSLYNSEL